METEDSVALPFSRRLTGPPYRLFWTKSSNLKFLVLDDVVSKTRLESVIRKYGGTVCRDAVHPAAIVLVPPGTEPPPRWGPVFSRQWLTDSIDSGSLRELGHYLVEGCAATDISRYRGGLTASLFFDEYKFRDSFLHPAIFTEHGSSGFKCDDNFKIICDRCHRSINTANDKFTSDGIPVDLHEEEGAGGERTDSAGGNEAGGVARRAGVRDKCGKRHLPYNPDLDSSSLWNNTDSVCADTAPLPSHTGKRLGLTPLSNLLAADPGAASNATLAAHPTVRLTRPEANLTDDEKPRGGQNIELQPQETGHDARLVPARVSHSDVDSDDGLPDLRHLHSVRKYRLVDKHTKTRFERREKEAILKFIIEKQAFGRLKSNALYREMEQMQVCPRRTYQSMKNHFLKSLVYELDSFSFLTDHLKIKLRGY